MTARRTRLRRGLTLVAVLALGSCGGEEGIDSKADFVAAADKICATRDERASKLTAVQSDADLGRLSGALADIYDKAITDLEALELPPGTDRPGAQKYVATTAALHRPVDRMKAASDRLVAAAGEGDTEALRAAGSQLQNSVNTVQALGVVADQAARDYGIRGCGATTPASPVS